MPRRNRNNISKRLSRVESTLKKDKPEVKSLDVLLNPLTNGFQQIYAEGVNIGTAAAPIYANMDLTRGFLQGLQNSGGNIDGNYCKLTSMDLRIFLSNPIGGPGTPTVPVPLPGNTPTNTIRLMIVRLPAAEILTPADVQTQVLEYGDPTTYGELCSVSPLKRNSTINGGYDVMYDRVHTLNTSTDNPNRSTKYIHFKKKWAKGLTLRFSGVANSLSLEQNRLYLFAFDPTNPFAQPAGVVPSGVQISFINRLRYSDE